MKSVAINGFGRIGRTILRAMDGAQRSRVVAINDIADSRTLAHLFRWDSTIGPYDGKVAFDDESITVDGHRIAVSSERDPARLPWSELKVDIVIEASGQIIQREKAAKHLDAGARKVILTSAAVEPDLNVIVGLNHGQYDTANHHLLAAGAGVTPCTTLLAKIVNDRFGIEQGSLTVVGSYLSDRHLLDTASRDRYRARSTPQNIVVSDGAYAAAGIACAIPELAGKLIGTVYRVPTPVGCLVELVAQVGCHPTLDEINSAFREAADGPFAGILEFNEAPLVLKDIVGNPHSSVFDSLRTTVNDGLLTVAGWIDNEWAYSNRVNDLVELLRQAALNESEG